MARITVEGLAAHRQRLRSFVRRLVGNDTLAEDLTQETFVRAARGAASYRAEATEWSWLCAIALNVVRDNARRVAHQPAPAADDELVDRLAADDDTEREVLRAEMSACIAEYAAQLPSPQYEVLIMHETAGLGHEEIAAALGISAGNSRVVLHRARAALQEILRTNCVLSFEDDDVPCERATPAKQED